MTESRRVILLGASGSIGSSTLDVMDHLAAERRAIAPSDPPPFELVAAAGGQDAEALAVMARLRGVRHLALAAPPEGGKLPDVPEGTRWYLGPDAATEMVTEVARAGDLTVSAIVGLAGLRPTLAAIHAGCDIALANKETLVAAGAVVIPAVADAGVRLLPVDSEHAAIAQCLLASEDGLDIERLVLTASGGPFRTWDHASMANASVEAALAHPTWAMGAKVSIDSASLMNKALELIEAHHLFGIGSERLEVLVHPQSIVHGLVEFVDGSVLASMAAPDMRTPIQQAMTWPERHAAAGRRMDWSTLSQLDFAAVDPERFPAPGLAFDAIDRGGTAGAILNAVDEVAVAAFLAGGLPFGGIVELVADAAAELPVSGVDCLDDVMQADEVARAWATAELHRRAPGSIH
ncbi:MAG: 1-deoxy-D-xylulose-5-phosphate reductoisomerase [Phycisphaerales bacterium]